MKTNVKFQNFLEVIISKRHINHLLLSIVRSYKFFKSFSIPDCIFVKEDPDVFD